MRFHCLGLIMLATLINVVGCASRAEKLAQQRRELFTKTDDYLQKWRQIMPGENPFGKQQLAERLGQLVWQQRAQFEAVIFDHQSVHRPVAISAVGFSRDVRWVPLLVAALEEEDEQIQLGALLSLGVIGNRHTPIRRIQVLATNTNPEVRANAVFTLGRIAAANEELAIDLLTASLKDPNVLVRANAAIAMGESQRPEMIAPLSEALNDPDAYVRTAVVSALGQIGTSDVPMLITPLQTDQDTRVRRAVRRVLEQLSHDQAIGHQSEQPMSQSAQVSTPSEELSTPSEELSTPSEELSTPSNQKQH